MNNLFKEKKIKLTNQRKLVLEIVKELGDSATSVNIANKCHNKVDKSTVYRIIELFVDKDVFSKNVNYNNEVYYSIKEEHGHYFTCIKCHKKEKINLCPLENIENDLENKKGYKVLNHTAEISGICSECTTK